ncbi:acetylxylan esterase, partial [bacterium]|nr:acetylxylan esterase [bacterium]
SPEEILAWQEQVRTAVTDLIGGLPERTPLNARAVGVTEGPGFTIERLLFESRPFFYVSANLYLPADRDEPGPAILIPCGHDRLGKADADTQRLARGLVKNGFVVLVIDPLGQGERSQYWDYAAAGSRVGLGVPEHEMAGTQSQLVGPTLASYRIWDGVRALDALCLRDEVDSARIGCAGCGAGGTLAMYLFALDERVRAAMPMCCLTTREAWLATGNSLDNEHVLPHAIEYGIDPVDVCLAGAPRPLRIGAVLNDAAPIEGARQAFRKLQRLYGLLDSHSRLDLFVTEGEAGLGKPLRQAAIEWFQLWLGDPSADAVEPRVRPVPQEELWCSPDGQTNSLGSRTVFSFTRDRALTLPPPMPVLESRGQAEEWQDDMRSTLRDLLSVPESSGAPHTRQNGVIFRGKIGIEMLSYQSERGVTVPALLFVPDTEPGAWPGIVYVHEGGKEIESGALGAIHMLTSQGNAVLAIDVRGVGETQSGLAQYHERPYTGADGYHAYQYAMLGRTLLGRRVHDVLRSVAVLAERPEVLSEAISVVGQGEGGILALFAAALDERIGTAVCCQSLMSYRDIATHEFHAWRPGHFIHGFLQEADLGRVAACVAPRRLILAGPVDHMRRRVTQEQANEAYADARKVYDLYETPESLQIATDPV